MVIDHEIKLDLSEIDDMDIVSECEERNYIVLGDDMRELLNTIYDKKKRGENIDIELTALIDNAIGRIL